MWCCECEIFCILRADNVFLENYIKDYGLFFFMDVKSEYESLARKHDLPRFDDISREVRLNDVEDSKLLLPEIREILFDKLRVCTDFLSELLQPDANLIGMYESKVFSESEKKDVYALFKRLMKYRRRALAAHIDDSDDRDAEFVREFWKEWLELKPKLLGSIEQIEMLWESDSEETEKLGYFG